MIENIWIVDSDRIRELQENYWKWIICDKIISMNGITTTKWLKWSPGYEHNMWLDNIRDMQMFCVND